MSLFKKSTVFALAAAGLSANLAMAQDFQSIQCTDSAGRGTSSLILARDATGVYNLSYHADIEDLGGKDEIRNTILARGLNCTFGLAKNIPLAACGTDSQKNIFTINLIEKSTTRHSVATTDKTDVQLLEVMLNKTGQPMNALTDSFLGMQKPMTVISAGNQQYQIDSAYQAQVVPPANCIFK